MVISQELLNFIQESRQQGKSLENIKASLLSAGWSQQDINQALEQIESEGEKVKPLPPTSTFVYHAPETEEKKGPLESPQRGFLSFFSPSFYSQILTGKKGFPLFLIILILAVLMAIRPSIFTVRKGYPLVKNLEARILSFIDEVYPAELEVKIQSGIASTNVTEPYYISVSKESLENLFSIKQKELERKSKIRILTIDTKGKAEEFERYQSLALLTQTSFVYYQDGKVNISSLRNIQDLTINKEKVVEKIEAVNRGNRIGKVLSILVLTAPLFLIFGGFIVYAAWFFIITLLAYLMIRINQLGLGFKNAFRYVAYLSFIPMILWNFAGFSLRFSSSVLEIIILAIAYSGIVYLKAHQEA